MATLEHIVYNIAENLQREHDMPFIERLRFMVPYYRSMLLRRDVAKGRKLDDSILQTLSDVTFKPANGLLCEFPTLKSEFKIPKPVRLTTGFAFRAVTSTDRTAIIHPVDYEAVRTLSYGRFTGHEPRYYYFEGHIWVICAPALEKLNIVAAFEDPFEAILFNDPSADLFTAEYPIPLDFVAAVTEMIQKTERAQADPVNDDVTVNE